MVVGAIKAQQRRRTNCTAVRRGALAEGCAPAVNGLAQPHSGHVTTPSGPACAATRVRGACPLSLILTLDRARPTALRAGPRPTALC